MKIEIVTPYQHLVSDEAEEVYAVGPKGEFGVLPGHAHYITPLAIGRLSYTKQGVKHVFVVAGGFLEVHGEQVTVLADEVEKPGDINAARARAELGRLEEKLAKEPMDPEEFQKTLAHRQKEEARLQVAAASSPH
jgi:F-type H+-transporting ATPase subunit epsilon